MENFITQQKSLNELEEYVNDTENKLNDLRSFIGKIIYKYKYINKFIINIKDKIGSSLEIQLNDLHGLKKKEFEEKLLEHVRLI